MHPSVGAFRFLLFSWLGFGNLNNGSGNAGLSALNGNNTLGNANWNYLARISEYLLALFQHLLMLTGLYPHCGENRVLMPPVSKK